MKRVISFILVLCLLVPLGAIGAFADDGSSWELKEFVDDFGDSTGEAYLRSIVSGTFSNTATSDEDMKVVIGYLPQKLGDNYVPTLTFRLVEYDDTLKVKATYTESDDITIKVKIDDEITEGQLIGTPPNGDLQLIGGPCILKIYDTLIETEQDVRTIIEIGSSKYSFTIDSEGFVERYEKDIQEAETKLVSGLSAEELMPMLSVKVSDVQISDTGAFTVKAEIAKQGTIKAFEDLQTEVVIDGTISADFYQNGSKVGSALLVLPTYGIGSPATVEGICLSGAVKTVPYEVRFAPYHLWAMEK